MLKNLLAILLLTAHAAEATPKRYLEIVEDLKKGVVFDTSFAEDPTVINQLNADKELLEKLYARISQEKNAFTAIVTCAYFIEQIKEFSKNNSLLATTAKLNFADALADSATKSFVRCKTCILPDELSFKELSDEFFRELPKLSNTSLLDYQIKDKNRDQFIYNFILDYKSRSYARKFYILEQLLQIAFLQHMLNFKNLPIDHIPNLAEQYQYLNQDPNMFYDKAAQECFEDIASNLEFSDTNVHRLNLSNRNLGDDAIKTLCNHINGDLSLSDHNFKQEVQSLINTHKNLLIKLDEYKLFVRALKEEPNATATKVLPLFISAMESVMRNKDYLEFENFQIPAQLYVWDMTRLKYYNHALLLPLRTKVINLQDNKFSIEALAQLSSVVQKNKVIEEIQVIRENFSPKAISDFQLKNPESKVKFYKSLSSSPKKGKQQKNGKKKRK